MYERSAIVLERYFENFLCYRNECNLRDNFSNYCELVAKLEKYQMNYQKEIAATQEYNVSVRKIKSIQAAQEKLYKRSAKLEYNRNLLFANIEGKPEETKKCIEKIENDVEQTNEEMKELKEELVQALVEHNDKRFELSKCKRYKKMAENDYNEIFETSRDNYEGITSEDIETAKKFAKFDDYEDIIEKLEENGKTEKIPFNEEVMQEATKFGVETAKKEVSSYIVMYDKMTKLLSDINSGTTKIELHKKYLRNEKAKLDFIYAAKDYTVQFLDYERMTIVHGRKSHNRLMSEACENFNTDVVQINNLYELLVKEVANKATKKAYKELYNKSYLSEIKEKEDRFKKEKNRINLNTATLLNSNYWRIEGIRNIYTVFYRNVSEVFGRDVAEFELPREFRENPQEDTDSDETHATYVDEIIEDSIRIPFDIEEDAPESSYDKPNNNNEDDEEDDDEEDESFNTAYEDILDNVIDEIKEGTDTTPEFDIFGEKYQDIDVTETIKKVELDDKNDEDLFTNQEEDLFVNEEPDEEPEEDYGLFNEVKKIKSKRSNNEIENFDITKEDKPASVLKKIKKINSLKKPKSESDVW